MAWLGLAWLGLALLGSLPSSFPHDESCMYDTKADTPHPSHLFILFSFLKNDVSHSCMLNRPTAVQHRATREPSGARQLIRITVQNDEAPLAEIDTLRVFAPRQPVPTLASPAATSTTTAADADFADVADKAAVTY